MELGRTSYLGGWLSACPVGPRVSLEEGPMGAWTRAASFPFELSVPEASLAFCSLPRDKPTGPQVWLRAAQERSLSRHSPRCQVPV